MATKKKKPAPLPSPAVPVGKGAPQMEESHNKKVAEQREADKVRPGVRGSSE
jgi:hypothetical protein